MMSNAMDADHLPTAKGDESLRRAVVYSVAAHVAVLAVFVVRMVIYPSEPLRLDDAIRVDIVALPDKGPKQLSVPVVETKIPPPSPAPVEPAPQDETKPPPPVMPPIAKSAPKPDNTKINLKKAKREQDEALKRLEALEKIEHMTKSQAPAHSAPQPVKGNQISHGGSLTGVTRLEQQGYLQTIDGAVKSHWNLPGFLSNANLSARARLFIDARGNVMKRVITQSSHNDIYDQRVLTAIDSSTPLPAPPSGLSSILETDGIELEFVPQ